MDEHVEPIKNKHRIIDKAADKVIKLKKLNIYEILIKSFEGILAHIQEDSPDVMRYRSEMKSMIETLIKEVEESENFFLKMLAYLESPEIVASHGLNTAIFSYIIANQLGLDRDTMFKILQAAFMHDAGKLNFSETVKERFIFYREDQKEQWKNHTVWGERLLINHLKAPEDIARMVSNHHEQYDGGGFPKGLKGEELKIEDCVIQTANMLDNILQKTGRSGFDVLAKTMEKILNGYSQKFHPLIRNTLIEILELTGEGRQHKRYKVHTRGHLRNALIDVTITCDIENISSGGISITATEPLSELTPYIFNAKIAEGLFIKDKSCKIVWNGRQGFHYHYGLRFDNPSTESLEDLLEHL